MAKRFGDLEKQAIAILANGGNPALIQDTRLANFWDWKTNPLSNAHDLPVTSTRKTGRKTDRYILAIGALSNSAIAQMARSCFCQSKIVVFAF